MTENRLELNKKPVYALPDDVLIGHYERRNKNGRIPDFEPDLVIVGFGRNAGEITAKEKHINQLWLKISDKKVLEFMSKYN